MSKTICPHCGPDCKGGAAHNARAEDGVIWKSEKRIRHIVGATRTIKTAVLVCEYLRDKCCAPHSKVHRDLVKYEFKEPCPENGYWSATILIDGNMEYPESERFVETCRAFVAGAGEIW
jgi:hypothetical protein